MLDELDEIKKTLKMIDEMNLIFNLENISKIFNEIKNNSFYVCRKQCKIINNQPTSVWNLLLYIEENDIIYLYNKKNNIENNSFFIEFYHNNNLIRTNLFCSPIADFNSYFNKI